MSFLLSDGSATINATEMSKPFNRLPKNWLANKSTKSFLDELSTVRGILLTDLIQIKQGGTNQGTWFHEDVALEFARWLSPKFGIWCNDRIKELITIGQTSLRPTDPQQILANAVLLAQKVIAEKDQEIEQLKPDANYAQQVLKSTSTYKVTHIAKDLGLKSATALNKKLNELGIQYNRNGVWVLYAKYQGNGYTKTETYPYIDKETGNVKTKMITVWTETGRRFICHTLGFSDYPNNLFSNIDNPST